MTISAAALVRTSLIFVVGKQRSNAGPQGMTDKTRATSPFDVIFFIVMQELENMRWLQLESFTFT
jgi:hypothetical protein